MKKINYLLFCLICLFSCTLVFAKDEVVIKSITPVYDEESSVVVNEDNSVIFNDRDQSVEYKVILENTTNKDLSIDNISLSKPTEDFLIYELEGLKKDDVIKANSNHEVIVSLSTIKKEGWGRNFNDELVASLSIDSSVLNPNTSTTSILVLLTFTLFVTAILVIIVKNRKITRYGTLVILIFSLIPIIKANKELIIPIKINASYESQNVMKPSGCYYDDNYDYIPSCSNFWENMYNINNIYIQNEINEITGYVKVYDVSDNDNGKVMAYLLDNDINGYDVYVQADGVIYPNEDMSYYFATMNLYSINNLEGLDTSNVLNMECLFCTTTIESDMQVLDLTSFDTRKVENMSSMFKYSLILSHLKVDMSNLDVSNVRDMSSMFYRLGWSSNSGTLELDLSGFYTKSVIDMSYMFYDTGANDENFTLDVSGFDTSNVTDMSFMFSGTGYNSESFSLDLSNFDTSNVTDMWGMFTDTGYNSTKLNTSIIIRNPNTTSYSNMFNNVATKIGSQITVNYTSETSDLVDKMIATKSTNSNVVKGVQVD